MFTLIMQPRYTLARSSFNYRQLSNHQYFINYL